MVKRRRFLNWFIAALAGVVGVVGVFLLPQAMTVSAFEEFLSLEAPKNFEGIDFSVDGVGIKKRSIDRERGPIERLVSIDKVFDPRKTYPGMQAVVTVVRRGEKCKESYIFSKNDQGELMMVGMSSESVVR